jgi:trigger factor
MGLLTASDKPNFKKGKEEDCVVHFTADIPYTELEAMVQTELVRIQQRARLPGFRPGKAPIDMVSKQFSGHAHEQAVDDLLRKYVPQALDSLGIQPVAAPSVEKLDMKPGKTIHVELKAEIAPKVTAKDYTKIKVTRKSYAPTDKELDARLDELRESHARLDASKAEAVGAKNYVVVDFQASRDGKPLPGGKGENELVDMSSDQTIEGLSEGLKGMKRGETKDIAVKIEAKPAQMAVTVKEIKDKILPALDAEFAKDVGFATLEELKAKLKEVIEKEGAAKTDREVSQQIEEALLKANKIPVPPSLVEAQLNHQLERLRRQVMGPKGQWPEGQLKDLRERLKPQAENEVRISYILSSIAEREKIQAVDADLSAELDKSLADAESDQQKDEIRRFFEEKKETISSMIRERKTLQFVREKAAITDEK